MVNVARLYEEGIPDEREPELEKALEYYENAATNFGYEPGNEKNIRK